MDNMNVDVQSVLLANRLKRSPEATVEPVVTAQTQPIAQTSSIVTPDPKTAVAPVVQPEVTQEKVVAKDKVEEPPAVETATVEPVVEDFKWDSNIPDATQSVVEPSTSADFKKLSSALSLDVKSEDEFIAHVNEKFAKLKELESLSLDGVPDQLKQAIEVAKKGGDWTAFSKTASIDTETLDPLVLFEREYHRTEQANYKNPDGSIDWQKLDEAHDSIPEAMRRMQGNMIKNNLTQFQRQQQTAIVAQAVAQQERFQKDLGDAAKELSNLLPKDKFGITIEPKHSSFLYEGIAKGTLVKKHLGNIDLSTLSKFDSKKLMRTLALAELGENVSQFQYKQGEAAGKKSLLRSTQNVNITGASHLPTPNVEGADTKSSADMLRDLKAKNQPKGSL